MMKRNTFCGDGLRMTLAGCWLSGCIGLSADGCEVEGTIQGRTLMTFYDSEGLNPELRPSPTEVTLERAATFGRRALQVSTRTGEDGIFAMELPEAGRWFLDATYGGVFNDTGIARTVPGSVPGVFEVCSNDVGDVILTP